MRFTAYVMIVALFVVLGTQRTQMLLADSIGETISSDTGAYHWGTPVQGFLVSVTRASPQSFDGRPVIVTVAIKNAGTNTQELVREFAYFDYVFQVRDHDGKLLPRRDDGPPVGASSSVGGRLMTLMPGAVQTESVDLRPLFNFKPGHYTVTVERPIRLVQKASTTSIGTATSAALTIIVQ